MTTWDQAQITAATTLGDLVEERRKIDAQVASTVAAARRMDMAWSQIAVGLGTSSQAAWERYGLTWEQKQQRAASGSEARAASQAILGTLDLWSVDPDKGSVPGKRKRAEQTDQG